MGSPRKPSFTVTVDEDLLQLLTNLTEALKENTLALTGNSPSVKVVQGQDPQVESVGQEAPKEALTAPAELSTPLAPPAGYQPPSMQTPVQATPPAGYPVQGPVLTQVPMQQMVMPGQIPTQYQPTQIAPPIQAPTQQVPTSAPSYSIEQIMQACAQLMDAGQPVLGLIQQKYGANTITEINPANYGILATDLRAMGAQL